MDTSSSTADAGFLTIREVCEEVGVTLRALRFYEAKGLIAPKREHMNRFYQTKDVKRLRKIVKLKSLGLSLREIRELLRSPGDGPYGLTANLCKELIERLSAQRDAVEAALAQLRGLGPQCTSTTVAISTDHGTMQ
jgi:DNA-binding transcriptional MerR regulator